MNLREEIETRVSMGKMFSNQHIINFMDQMLDAMCYLEGLDLKHLNLNPKSIQISSEGEYKV